MKRRWATVLVCALLATATMAVYWPVRNHEFLNYDDPDYVTENHHVKTGLTWKGVQWAFTRIHGERTYWHPLTWLSHMLDCQWFGLNAGAHHLVNVGFHVANALLLFLLLCRLTGTLGRSTVVAALFALHPLQVDSVAWVTERKNLLSTLFFLLCLWAYERYVHKAGVERQKGNDDNQKPEINSPIPGPRFLTSHFYWLALLFFALGLMSKPAVVTLPFVLLLLDYWPLQRFHLSIRRAQLASMKRLLLEKVPFLLLAAASSAVTIVAHKRLGILWSGDQFPMAVRAANALMSYASYIRKVFWPHDLAIFYPYSAAWPAWQLVAAALFLLAITAFVLLQQKRHSYLLVGWCWFLGSLVPTIGLVQAGDQAMADRFAYVPIIGLFLMVVWGSTGSLAHRLHGKTILGGTATAALVLCSIVTRQQLQHWKDSVTVFEHAAAVTEANAGAHNSLGVALLARGRMEEAAEHFKMAAEINPRFIIAYHNLGNVRKQQGQAEKLLEDFKSTLSLHSNDAATHLNVGMAMAQAGLLNEAIQQYEEALRLAPDYASVHNNLAIVLVRQGRLQEALGHALTALKSQSDNADYHNNLGNIYAAKGEHDKAVFHYQEALRLQPDLTRAHFNLGNSLIHCGKTNEAAASYLRATELDPNYWQAHRSLAELYAGLGDWKLAIHHHSQVLQLNSNQFSAWNDLGAVMARAGRTEEAMDCFTRALKLKPDFTTALANLGNALIKSGQPGEAIERYREALRHAPHDARLHYALARVLHSQAIWKESLEQFREAIKYEPNWAEALNDTAWVLATARDSSIRNGGEAVRLAEQANKLTGGERPNVLGTIAAAYAETGRFDEAVAMAERALAEAERRGLQELAEQTRARLSLYRAGEALREP